MHAASFAPAELVRELLAAGARIDERSLDGHTALSQAIAQHSRLSAALYKRWEEHGDREALSQYERVFENCFLLIEAGADVNLAIDAGPTSQLGYTPLMLAAGAGHAPLVRRLLAAGARVEPQAADGKTAPALALALRRAPEGLVEALRAAGRPGSP
jgi:uncharacterized protein